MEIGKQNRRVQEQISALVDGECATHELDLALSALKAQAYTDEWEIYHQIGDILKSEDLNIGLSADFTAHLAASLASEPVYRKPSHHFSFQFSPKVAYAVAAMLTLATILVPQFAGHEGAETGAPYLAGHFVAATNGAQVQPALLAVAGSQTANARTDQSRMLRDPQIDGYLAAHQRYSNSMYSAIEYETGPISQEAEK